MDVSGVVVVAAACFEIGPLLGIDDDVEAGTPLIGTLPCLKDVAP